MVQKIITHVASIVAQSKRDRVRDLGRGARSKIKRHSSPVSLSSKSHASATRLKSWSRTAPSNRTQGYDTHFWKNHHRLLFGNSNVLSLTGK